MLDSCLPMIPFRINGQQTGDTPPKGCIIVSFYAEIIDWEFVDSYIYLFVHHDYDM